MPDFNLSLWKRIASRPRSKDLTRVFQAQVRDPLWFLARQWQLNEFKGDDAASPYWIRFQASTSELNAFSSPSTGHPERIPYNPTNKPIVKCIENESVFRDNFNTKIDLGQRFSFYVKKEVVDSGLQTLILEAYQQAYPLSKLPKAKPIELVAKTQGDFEDDLNHKKIPEEIKQVFQLSEDCFIEPQGENSWHIYDPELNKSLLLLSHPTINREFIIYDAVIQDKKAFAALQLIAHTTLDGSKLLFDIVDPGRSPLSVVQFPEQISDETRAILQDIHQKLRLWSEAVYGDFSSGETDFWLAEQVEYQAKVFAESIDSQVGTGSLMEFDVYPGFKGEIDWYSFDQSVSKEALEASNVETIQQGLYPMRLFFRGMPNKRWWEFEDRQVDLGNINIETSELSKIAFTSFLTMHTDDWFVVPFSQKAGSLCKIDYLIVHDVFGGKTLIESAVKDEDDPWALFSNTIRGRTGGTGNYFILPPAGSQVIQNSEPIEEVKLIRDEMANMVWAIESIVEDHFGFPWPGYERAKAGQNGLSNHSETTPSAPLKYILNSGAPENWIPLLPVQIAGQFREILFKKGAMLSNVLDALGNRKPILAFGKILNPNGADKTYRIREEEIPRIGKKIQRVIRRSRWVDGSIHIWIGKNVRSGKGEGNSGMQFDLVKPTPAPPTSPADSPQNQTVHILDAFKRPLNSNLADCETLNILEGQLVSYPYVLPIGTESSRACWIDHAEDISTNLNTSSGNAIDLHRWSILQLGISRDGADKTAIIDYVDCENDSCKLSIRTREDRVSVLNYRMRYGLPDGAFFNLWGFRGARVVIESSDELFYLQFYLYDYRNRYWANIPHLAVAANPEGQHVEFLFSELISPHGHEPYDPILNRIKSIMLVVVNTTGKASEIVLDRIEFF